MLRKFLLLAMGTMVVSASIATVSAQKGPAPAKKAPPASDAAPAAKAPAKAAGQSAVADDDEFNPFGDPPPKALRPFGKAAVSTQDAAKSKPAAKKLQPAANAKQPLRFGEKAIIEVLDEQATLDFVETPLKDVFEYLQNKHRIPIKLDTAALREAGVDADTHVTCSISDVPLRSALRIMLNDLQLQWTIWSDVLWITSPTKAESDEYMVTRIYDVTDLLVETRDRPFRGNGLPTSGASEPSSPGMDGSMGSGAGVSGMGGMGGGMGGMGGGFFSVSPEGGAPAASPSPGSATVSNVISCTPAVGAAERGGATGGPSSPVASQAAAQTPHGVGGMGIAYAVPSPGGEMQALMDLVTNTVATKTWVDNGGTGTISPFGNLLCISQTFHVQCEVKALLADLRAKRRAAPNIVVELQWLWLDGGQYEQLLGGAKPSPDGLSQLAVDAKALDLLARKVPGFRGRIACANGQLVHLASGDRRSIIVSTIPVVGSGIGYSPVVQAPNSGVVVELRPTVAPGGTTATVDVRSVVTRWGKPQATAHVGAAWPPGKITEGANTGVVHQETTEDPAGSGSCPVQRPNMPTQQLATTVRVPLGKPVVLGGMTFAPAESAGMDKATGNPIQLYLIATTSIAK